jgi:hypothetical protein
MQPEFQGSNFDAGVSEDDVEGGGTDLPGVA